MVNRILTALICLALPLSAATKQEGNLKVNGTLEVTQGTSLQSATATSATIAHPFQNNNVLTLRNDFNGGALGSPIIYALMNGATSGNFLLFVDDTLGTVLGVNRNGLVTSVGGFAGPGAGLTGIPFSAIAPSTSAQLAGLLTDETGTGQAVFGTAPTITNANLVTPTLGAATATSLAAQYHITNHATGGTNLLPAFTRDIDLDSGMYFSGLDEVAFASAGVRTLRLSTVDADFTVPVEVPPGTVLIPGLKFDGFSDSGLFIPPGNVGICTSYNGVHGLTLGTQALTLGPSQSVAPTVGYLRGTSGLGFNVAGAPQA